MPDLTGIELCQHIRGQGQSIYTHVIMLTSMTDKEKIVSGLAAGADDYLTNPSMPRNCWPVSESAAGL